MKTISLLSLVVKSFCFKSLGFRSLITIGHACINILQPLSLIFVSTIAFLKRELFHLQLGENYIKSLAYLFNLVFSMFWSI